MMASLSISWTLALTSFLQTAPIAAPAPAPIAAAIPAPAPAPDPAALLAAEQASAAAAANKRASEAEAKAEAIEAKYRDLASGKFIENGVTGGLALTLQAPMAGDAAVRQATAVTTTLTPYLLLIPRYWQPKPETNRFCASQWSTDAQRAIIAADDMARQRVAPSQCLDDCCPERLVHGAHPKGQHRHPVGGRRLDPE